MYVRRENVRKVPLFLLLQLVKKSLLLGFALLGSGAPRILDAGSSRTWGRLRRSSLLVHLLEAGSDVFWRFSLYFLGLGMLLLKLGPLFSVHNLKVRVLLCVFFVSLSSC